MPTLEVPLCTICTLAFWLVDVDVSSFRPHYQTMQLSRTPAHFRTAEFLLFALRFRGCSVHAPPRPASVCPPVGLARHPIPHHVWAGQLVAGARATTACQGQADIWEGYRAHSTLLVRELFGCMKPPCVDEKMIQPPFCCRLVATHTSRRIHYCH